MRTPSNPLSKKIDTQSTIKAKTSMRAMASKGYFFATARAPLHPRDYMVHFKQHRKQVD